MDKLSFETYVEYNNKHRWIGHSYLDASKTLLEALSYMTTCIELKKREFNYKRAQLDIVNNILWGLTWCLSQTDNSFIKDVREDKKDVTYAEVQVTMSTLRSTGLTSKIQELNNDLLRRIDLSPNKKKLIAEGILVLPNNKVDIEVMKKFCVIVMDLFYPKDITSIISSYVILKCKSKTKPMCASTYGELYQNEQDNKKYHANDECKCFCNCENCWHDVCCINK